MDRYIGLDVHAQTTTVAVMSATGKHLSEKVIETNARLLVETITAVAGALHVGLEEGMHSEWIYELLVHRVTHVVVMIPPRRDGTKNDSHDAWWAADQLRLGVPQKQVFKSKLSGLREAVRAYQAFTKHATRAKLQLRFLARGRGLSVDRAQLVNPEERQKLVAQLPATRRVRAKLHGEFVDQTERLREQAKEELEQNVRRCPDVRRLQEVPGLWLIRASQIVAAVITPHRFRTRQQFWSYCGLAIITRSSSDWIPKGGTMVRSQRARPRGLAPGNLTLKCAFKAAALDVVHRYPKHPWALAYQRAVETGQRSQLALLTLARKIAETVLHIWKHEEDYDPTKHKTQAAA